MKDQYPAEIKPATQRDAERLGVEGRPGQEGKEKKKEEEEEDDDDEDEEEDDEEEEEEECSVSVEAELACMEEKWREQCTINENLKLLLASEEQQFKVREHTQSHTTHDHSEVPATDTHSHIYLNKMSAHTSMQTQLNKLIFSSGSLRYHISVSLVSVCEHGSH